MRMLQRNSEVTPLSTQERTFNMSGALKMVMSLWIVVCLRARVQVETCRSEV